MPYTFVLVHGAWHYGALYDEVDRYLERGGNEVHTPTAAGHGPGADPTATMADAVESIVDYITGEDLHDIILVGHSWGGAVLTQVAPRLADRVRRVVFHNAFIPQDGHSVLDEVPPASRQAMEALVDPDTGLVEMPWPLWRNSFIQDADLDLARETHKLLTPEPIAMFATALDQAPFFDLVYDGSLETSYLAFDGDEVLLGRDYGWFPRFAERLPGCRAVRVPGGSHEVMFTDPSRLAENILVAGRD